MKIDKEGFKPFKLEIESLEEAKVLYTLAASVRNNSVCYDLCNLLEEELEKELYLGIDTYKENGDIEIEILG